MEGVTGHVPVDFPSGPLATEQHPPGHRSRHGSSPVDTPDLEGVGLGSEGTESFPNEDEPGRPRRVVNRLSECVNDKTCGGKFGGH